MQWALLLSVCQADWRAAQWDQSDLLSVSIPCLHLIDTHIPGDQAGCHHGTSFFFFFIVFFFVCLSVFLVQHRKPTRQSVLLLNWASALLLAIRVDGDQGKWCLQELVVWGLVAQYTHPFIARLFVSFTRKYMRSLFLSERNEWGFYTILVLFSCYGSQGFSLDSAR